jgi:secreted PhoX family phosphatase
MKVGNGGQFEGTNSPAITGAFTWEAITNSTGGAISGVSTVLGDGSIDGRATADNASVKATGYNRPEDLELQNLAGNQLIYFTTTDSDIDNNGGTGTSRVYNFNVTTNTVNLFADANTTDLATGLAVGGALRSSDNLAIDAEGNIYIIEDRNGGVDNDIWFAKDINKDGDLLDAGEGLARWASNGTQGSEFTGLYFDKFNSNVAYVNIQHPTSGNDRTMQINAVPVPGAVWLFGSAIAGMIGLRRSKA